MENKGKALLVDDEPLNLGFMSGYLADIGYDVATASSGEEALAIVAANMPDIILIDIMMPGLNGYQVTRKLKNKRETSNMPIVLVTALGAKQGSKALRRARSLI